MALKRNLIFLAIATLCNLAMAQQPFGGCWHPNNIINWSPEKDPDAKFNRSTVALQPRFEDNSVKANANQHPEGRVSACLTMNPMCSQTPSQGANNFVGYNPTYWQYMDLLIWWGGSAGEGIIIPPSAPVTDIAHLNGVKVLGQLFFPPQPYGGQVAWVNEILTKEGNSFPYAKKMYEIAAYYGFDGWFINEETAYGNGDWAGWIDYFNKCAKEGGHPEMEIQWYDCARSMGDRKDLMKLDNTSYFLNYGSADDRNVKDQTKMIMDLGFTREDVFKKLYFGIEVAQNGLDGNAGYFNCLFPTTGHTGSIDLFNPEEHTWKRLAGVLLNTEDACGQYAYKQMQESFVKESRFWTNEQHDPSNTSAKGGEIFPGLANAILERSTIQNLPFVTSFSAGLGKHRFVNGEKKGTHDWYHRGMQDILPTWRWWVEAGSHKNDIKFEYNWDDAYNMGTSVKVSGKLASGTDYLTRLYKTKLKISNGDKFQLVVKGNLPSTLELKLGISEKNNALKTFALTKAATKNGWSILSADLSSIANQTVSIIALNMKGNGNTCDFLLGQLSVLPANYSPAALNVTNLQCQNKLEKESGDLRLIWDAPVSKDVHHYNIYVTHNGKRSLVGQTRNEGFYCETFKRNGLEDKSVIAEVTTVTKDMKEGSPVKITVDFPDLEKPHIQLIANKTLVKKNEMVEFTAIADNYPKSYKWTIPQGTTKVTENGNKITVKFTEEGEFDMSVSVSNAIGTSTETIKGLVMVSDIKVSKLENVSKGKSIHSASGSLDPETPENLIDGKQVPGDVHEKWCIGGKKQHWVVIDLEEPYQIFEFKFFDCGHKENKDENVQNYKIWVSNDTNNWGEPVVDASNRPENTKNDHIKSKIGRYVKFMPYDDDKPITIRIWEFEVFGLSGGPLFEIGQNVSLPTKSSKDMSFKFNLNDTPKADDFKVTLKVEDENVATISDVKVNDKLSEVTYKINSGSTAGMTNMTVEMTNNGWTKMRTIRIETTDASLSNLLANRIAKASRMDYAWTSSDTPDLTDNNMNTGYTGNISDGPDGVKVVFDCEENCTFSKAIVRVSGGDPIKKIRCEVSLTGKEDSYTEVGQCTDEGEILTFALNSKLAQGRYIRFWFSYEDYSEISIQEIEAYGKVGITTGLVEENNISYVSPTIFDNELVIYSDSNEDITITNIAGITMFRGNTQSQRTTIMTDVWASGIYFVRLGNHVTKVIRK